MKMSSGVVRATPLWHGADGLIKFVIKQLKDRNCLDLVAIRST